MLRASVLANTATSCGPWILSVVIAWSAAATPALAQQEAAANWQALFNGENLQGWIAKIRGYPVGTNFGETFRVEDGVLSVSYEHYDDFEDRFGHLFHAVPYSHYRLRLEYRFVGEQARNAPAWALRNSGVMLHSQAPATMRVPQDFPISIEVQFLGAARDDETRPTGNVCTPGTQIIYEGRFTDAHCVNSSSPAFAGEQWVRSETLVLGADRVVHFINGEAVLEYGGITTGGGVVTDYDPAFKPAGRPLAGGFIALQSEGHPVQFRHIELLDLKGCMDPAALNFRDYFLEPDPQACRY